ncbi:MAG: ATP synthase subunit I [Burkholderiales bacterium]|nr:ATP synthase subunit I [Burkholderiales bacterium]
MSTGITPRALDRAVRAVLRWQAAATAALALFSGIASGWHGAASAALGGAVSMGAGALSAWVAGRRRAPTAGGIVAGALVAEGVKIGAIAVLLWLVLVLYRDVVVIAFLASFMVTALIFSMAFFVRDR